MKDQKKKKHVKRKGRWATQTAAVVRESGALTRVVLEKEAKAAQARKKKRKAKNDKEAGWRNFCYDDFDKNVRNRAKDAHENVDDMWNDEDSAVAEARADLADGTTLIAGSLYLAGAVLAQNDEAPA